MVGAQACIALAKESTAATTTSSSTTPPHPALRHAQEPQTPPLPLVLGVPAARDRLLRSLSSTLLIQGLLPWLTSPLGTIRALAQAALVTVAPVLFPLCLGPLFARGTLGDGAASSGDGDGGAEGHASVTGVGAVVNNMGGGHFSAAAALSDEEIDDDDEDDGGDEGGIGGNSAVPLLPPSLRALLPIFTHVALSRDVRYLATRQLTVLLRLDPAVSAKLSTLVCGDPGAAPTAGESEI